MRKTKLDNDDRVFLESSLFALDWLLNELRSNDYALDDPQDKARAKHVLSSVSEDIREIIEKDKAFDKKSRNPLCRKK